MLTERVAVAIWRQRRLICAETAEITVRQQTSIGLASLQIRNGLNLKMGSSGQVIRDAWHDHGVYDAEFTSADWLNVANCCRQTVGEDLLLEGLERKYPDIYANLLNSSSSVSVKISELVDNTIQGVRDFLRHRYFDFIEFWQMAYLKEVVRQYKQSIALPKMPESMARYQSALDNELYKAQRVLREAQNWRIERRLAE